MTIIIRFPLKKMATFGERLNAALNRKGVKPVELARHLGISRSGVSQLINGQSKNPRPEHLLGISRFLQVRIEWLIEGSGEMDQSSMDFDSMADRIDALQPAQRALIEKMIDELTSAHTGQNRKTL